MQKTMDRPSDDGEEQRSGAPVNLVSAWRTVLSRPGLVGSCVVAALAFAFIYLQFVPATYRATVLVSIDPKVDSAIVKHTAVTDANAASAIVESETEILSSPHIARALVKSQSLENDPALGGGRSARELIAIIAGRLDSSLGVGDKAPLSRLLQAPAKTGAFERVASELERRVKVKRIGTTYVVSVSVDMPGAESAARIANAYVDTFIAARLQAQKDGARRSTELLSERAEDLQRRAMAAEIEVEQKRVGANTVGADAASAKVSLRNLESMARTYRALYDKFLESYAEASQSGMVALPSAQIVSPATAPTKRNWPNTTLVLAAALLGGFSLGALLVLVRSR